MVLLMITSMIINKTLLKKNKENKIDKRMVTKINRTNCIFYYYLSNIFNLSSSTEVFMGFIECLFSMLQKLETF